MPKASWSTKAKADLLNIGAYTARTWGESQAIRYLDSIEHCVKMLAEKHALGRRCDWIRLGLHRFETGRHVVFYRPKAKGIFVVRILHQSMLPDRQSYGDEGRET